MNRHSRQPQGLSKIAQVKVKVEAMPRSAYRSAGIYLLFSAFALSLLSALSQLSHF